MHKYVGQSPSVIHSVEEVVEVQSSRRLGRTKNK